MDDGTQLGLPDPRSRPPYPCAVFSKRSLRFYSAGRKFKRTLAFTARSWLEDEGGGARGGKAQATWPLQGLLGLVRDLRRDSLSCGPPKSSSKVATLSDSRGGILIKIVFCLQFNSPRGMRSNPEYRIKFLSSFFPRNNTI